MSFSGGEAKDSEVEDAGDGFFLSVKSFSFIV